MTRLVAPLITILAGAWVALLVFAPFLPVPLAGVLYVFGSVICHQIPERSFHVDGAQLPVCARCFGIYLGAAIACAGGGRAPRLAGREGRFYLLALATIPTAITLLLEWTGLHSSNVTRAAAGATLGAVAALVVMAAVQAPALHYGACARTRRSEFSQPAPHI